MSQQPILGLQPAQCPQEDTPKATPHLLPCRVYHAGPVEPVDSFWDPNPGENGTSTAYFRGRKLQGTTVPLPAGYRGLVAATVASGTATTAEGEGEAHDAPAVIDLEAPELPQGTLQTQAEFDEMVVWGHEAAVDPAADPYLRGAREWLAVAEKIHSFSAPAVKEK
ncbi:ribonuclease H2 non-catalytic subunit-domain-containing protein [Staphylotrichum tortipilum]|uniref:Ribonuclease H2 non-catalytic subunit-domain-containing protein n=1 Tax=Staphylotrichum tortipilum TaxID=2831512 RepID=A0AAN6RXF5_9PEZI|nr:ribonuclease H2 non-catalytic subunit-domain-containing protein [Staphylotrichum longicolle]